MKLLLVASLALGLNLERVHGHSWLGCAQYTAELSDSVQNFEFDSCDGYGRGYFAANNPTTFSAASGDKMNSGSVTCQYSITDPITDGYTDTYPYATYTPGSTYRLVWPAKNHGIGEECGETQSTDKAMAIYVNPQVNPSSDLTSIDDYTLVYDWHAESGETFTNGKAVEGVPFANCRAYCEDTDASPCFGDMIIPEDLFTQSGFYTFLWYWEFSSLYVTCFDVYVDVDGDVDTIGETTDPTTGGDDTTDDEPAIITWQAQSPMCYDGATYDETLIVDTLESLFSSVDAEFEVIDHSEHADKDAFNFTVETYTVSVGVVVPGINNGTACQRLVTAFGTGTCSVCNGGTIVSQFSSKGGNGGSSSGSNFVVALVVVLVIVLLIVGAGVGYQRHREKNSA